MILDNKTKSRYNTCTFVCNSGGGGGKSGLTIVAGGGGGGGGWSDDVGPLDV